MELLTRRFLAPAIPLFLLSFAGCGPSSQPPTTATVEAPAAATNNDEATNAGGSGPAKAAEKPAFKFGDMIEPFTPPTLAELEKQVEWVDRPVIDAINLLKDHLASSQPRTTVDEALKLPNNSKQTNDQILSALGRQPDNPQQVEWNAEVNRHAYGDVNSTNPLLVSSVVESEVIMQLAFGLFNFDWEFKPFATAETVVSWQTSKDAMYDKVVMRKDLVWSDGKPITAHDVVFSFKTILTSAVPVPALRTGRDKLKWVEAYDDHTLVFFQKEPLAINSWNLNFYVVPRHIYEPHLAADPTLTNHPEFVKLENNPVTGGPYRIASRTRGQEIVLERREDWFMQAGQQVRDKPYFKTIRFRIRPDLSAALLALKAGDIDEMMLTPEIWQNQSGDASFYDANTKPYGLEWTEFHFLWNCQEPLFADKRVRTAMAHAMDYQELIERLRFGIDEQCAGVFHPTARWAAKPTPPLFKQDLDKAEELLTAAGWTDSDGDGVRDKLINGKKVKFEFTVLTANKQDRIDVCTLLRDCLCLHVAPRLP